MFLLLKPRQYSLSSSKVKSSARGEDFITTVGFESDSPHPGQSRCWNVTIAS
jgi:sulfite reductase alpha subunit-like flavoprotein